MKTSTTLRTLVLTTTLVLIFQVLSSPAEERLYRFYQFDSPMIGANHRKNDFHIFSIQLSWLPEVVEPTPDGPVGEVLWRIDSLRPIRFSGFEFNLFQQPDGFTTITMKLAPLPEHGHYILRIIHDEPGASKGFRVYLTPSHLAKILPDHPTMRWGNSI